MKTHRQTDAHSIVRQVGLLDRMRGWAKPSNFVRLLWLSVALLHGWLIVQRDWLSAGAGLMDHLRVALCLAAVAYASLKLWRVATIFDSAPRRVLVSTLAMVVLHWMIAAPADQGDINRFDHPLDLAAIVIAAPAVAGVLLLVAGDGRRPRPHARRPGSGRRPAAWVIEFSHLPLAVLRHSFLLRNRPPPLAA